MRRSFFDPELAALADLADATGATMRMATTTGVQGPTPASGAQGGAPAPMPRAASLIPFVRAARAAAQQDFALGPYTLSANTQNIGPINLQANGWLRSVEIYVQGASASNVVGTVAFQPDAPFNVIQSFSMLDPAGNPIVNPISGYYLMLWIKYGVFDDPPYADPRADNAYSVTTVGGTGGSFNFILKLPVETAARDGFTVLPNGAADRRYRVNITLNNLAGVYSTQPTNAPTVTINGTSEYYIEPPQVINGAAVQQTPNGYGSKGYLEFESPVVTNGGSLRPQLINMGRTIRNQVLILRNSSGVRDSTDWPDPFYIFINNFQQWYLPKAVWLSGMSKAYGYGQDGIGFDTAGGLDTGVFVVYQYMLREGKLLNSSPRGQYLPTVGGTKYVLQGVFGTGASTLDILQHAVVASPQALYN